MRRVLVRRRLFVARAGVGRRTLGPRLRSCSACPAGSRGCAIRSPSRTPSRWEPGPATPASGARPPNIVVIVADDLGYNDLTFAGGGVANGAVPTPNIDSIARDGVEFTHGYAGNATCAPSRAAIMTGRYPTRFGFEFTPAPKPFMRLVAHFSATTGAAAGLLRRPREGRAAAGPGGPAGRARSRSRSCCKTHGYRTLGLGKWHLGEAPRDAARGARLRRVSRLPAPAPRCTCDPDDPNVGELAAGLRPDRPVPVGEPALRGAARTAARASRPTRT